MEIENHGAELIPVEVGTRTGQSLSYKFGESVKCNSSSVQLFFYFYSFFPSYLNSYQNSNKQTRGIRSPSLPRETRIDPR